MCSPAGFKVLWLVKGEVLLDLFHQTPQGGWKNHPWKSCCRGGSILIVQLLVLLQLLFKGKFREGDRMVRQFVSQKSKGKRGPENSKMRGRHEIFRAGAREGEILRHAQAPSLWECVQTLRPRQETHVLLYHSLKLGQPGLVASGQRILWHGPVGVGVLGGTGQ